MIHKNFIRHAGLLLFFIIFSAGVALADTTPYEPLQPGMHGIAGRRTPIVAAIEKARPAVVSIFAQGETRHRDPFYDDFFNRFFEDSYRRRSRPDITFGSGVIIDGQKGLVVTNEHVVRGASKIAITLTDGRELPAEIVGTDPRFDLAVLSVKSQQPLPEVRLGDSDGLMIGETVIAIGNPFGLLSHTATTGVVSATGRSLPGAGREDALHDLIQTDASINPGNSGGPLLNINAEVIGINTAIMARGEGLGFAIPSDQVKRITARLMRGDLVALDLGLELAEAGRPKRGETGCLVLRVHPGGPADKGGVKKGDMIMKLDGSPTATMADYEMIVSSVAPGQPIKAEIARDGQTVILSLTPKTISESEALDMAWRLYGLKVYEKGGRLMLERPADRSPAAGLGLREGDMLLGVGSTEMKRKADLAQSMLANRFQPSISITVQRGRTIYKATLSQ